jgi:peptide-methionine (S)-S-oxide reductase
MRYNKTALIIFVAIPLLLGGAMKDPVKKPEKIKIFNASTNTIEEVEKVYKTDAAALVFARLSDPPEKNTEKAAFAAGCFWGVEAAFQEVKGVVNTAVGFAGGRTKNPTYEEVCTNTTGHAETVLVKYDPAAVTYEQLLNVFFSIHDPTTVNRQGPDVGSQYRSAIFYYTPQQEKAAQIFKNKLTESGKFNKPIVTEITPAGEFYKAEDYHQRYYRKHGLKPTCHLPTPS